ncbi:MAG: methyltransferase domain-containing protein [Phycisphaerales bacterium]|nr:methyltransferase domain-containing protein [Phycisphaerales bacterium]MCB9862377.1 methyltransferase domain-containing protein [Phycisphaerales bacterium]
MNDSDSDIVNPENDSRLNDSAENAGTTAELHRRRAVKHKARTQFDSWAHTYDRSIVQHLLFQPSYRLFMQELYRWRKNLEAPFDLLDIGAGTGTWTAMVAGSPLPSRQVVGLDYSKNMCRLGHRKASEIGAGAPHFINGDAEHLPFDDASFDAVTCSNSFHHYPHQQAAIIEMRRILRPGGRLMLIDGFRDNVIGWTLFDVFITRAESTPTAAVHHASWSQMRTYFEHAGFTNIRQKKTGIWAPIFITIGVA